MRALVASMIALVQLLAVPARARAGPAGHTPDYAAALAHLERGVTAFRAGDYPRALEAFDAAQRLAPDKPNPYRWLALTQVQLGDCPSALLNIEGFVSRVPAREPRVAELVRLREMCLQTGVLVVRSSPPAVSLRIDGEPVGRTPYRALSMRAGEHMLAASRPGYATHSQTIAIAPGGALDVHVRLEREPAGLSDRWWFWPAVAGVAVAAVAIGFAAADGPDPTVLTPITCDDTGCRADTP